MCIYTSLLSTPLFLRIPYPLSSPMAFSPIPNKDLTMVGTSYTTRPFAYHAPSTRRLSRRMSVHRSLRRSLRPLTRYAYWNSCIPSLVTYHGFSSQSKKSVPRGTSPRRLIDCYLVNQANGTLSWSAAAILPLVLANGRRAVRRSSSIFTYVVDAISSHTDLQLVVVQI